MPFSSSTRPINPKTMSLDNAPAFEFEEAVFDAVLNVIDNCWDVFEIMPTNMFM